MKLYLTKRICAEIGPYLQDCRGNNEYEAAVKICMELSGASATVRGGACINIDDDWPPSQVIVLRDVLRAALAGCTQMQVRQALQDRIEQCDNYLGTSAVERLARLS